MSTMFKIFIGNISFKTTEEQLREKFAPLIPVEDLVIARDEATGRSKGYGFVMTRDADEGRRAMYRLGKFEMDGRLIYLKEAHGKKLKKKKFSRQGPPPRRDRQGGGFNSHSRPRGNFTPRPRPDQPLSPTVRPNIVTGGRDRVAPPPAAPITGGYEGLTDQRRGPESAPPPAAPGDNN